MDRWHIPPDVWLKQDIHFRNGIFKKLALDEEADSAPFVPAGAQVIDPSYQANGAPAPGLFGNLPLITFDPKAGV